LLLDFHYSDTWADPAQQAKPAAWRTNTFAELASNLFDYTRAVTTNLIGADIAPDAVQLGNEITYGFLWNEGRVGGDAETKWGGFCALLQAAAAGMRTGAGTNPAPRIVIQIDAGANNGTCRWFFDNLLCRAVPFDIIGLSYYPWWHGNLAAFASNINDLAVRYGRDIAVVETGYPWTLDNYDPEPNFVWEAGQLLPGHPATVDGQRRFLLQLKELQKAAAGEPTGRIQTSAGRRRSIASAKNSAAKLCAPEPEPRIARNCDRKSARCRLGTHRPATRVTQDDNAGIRNRSPCANRANNYSCSATS